jgi:hypothetical protein
MNNALRISMLEETRQSRNELMERLKVQQRLKTELHDRKSLASQMRMKSIANLASDTPNGKRRRKNDDDMFGANDADWNIYKDIGTSKEGTEFESENDEERTIEALPRLEGVLLIHDAAFDETQLVDEEKIPPNPKSTPSYTAQQAHWTTMTPHQCTSYISMSKESVSWKSFSHQALQELIKLVLSR